MHISAEQILGKMTSELAEAGRSPHRMREHVAVVRALCDLLLEAQGETAGPLAPVPAITAMPQPRTAPVYRQEADANGGSLLDF